MMPSVLFLLTLSLPVRIFAAGIMEAKVNPGCDHCGPEDQLVYAKSDFGNETLHYLWSSITDDEPTFLMAQSLDDNDIGIQWQQLLKGIPGSINATSLVNDVAIVVKDIRLWNDTQKSGVFNHSDVSTTKDLKRMQKNVTLVTDSQSAKAVFLFYEEEDSNLTVTLVLSTGVSESRFADLPHLLMSPTAFHLQVTVAGDPLLNYTNCRLVLDMEVFHRRGSLSIGSETTIDDEYSPGVFSISTAKLTGQDDRDSYLTWKSVAYNKPDRIIAHTVDSDVKLDASNKTTGGKVITGFFTSVSDYEVSSLNVSFGAAKDSFYSEFNSFSFVVGLGVPAKDGLSFLVQLIIWIGFGIPVLALIVAAVYMTVKRIRNRGSRELLLQD